MASDSLVSAGRVLGSAEKIFKMPYASGMGLVACAGHAEKCAKFEEWVKGPHFYSTILDLKSVSDDDDFEALVVPDGPPGAAWLYETGCVPQLVRAPFFAIGSGAALAVGAMERGATAAEAVEVAIKWDVYCGGEIQILKFSRESDNAG